MGRNACEQLIVISLVAKQLRIRGFYFTPKTDSASRSIIRTSLYPQIVRCCGQSRLPQGRMRPCRYSSQPTINFARKETTLIMGADKLQDVEVTARWHNRYLGCAAFFFFVTTALFAGLFGGYYSAYMNRPPCETGEYWVHGTGSDFDDACHIVGDDGLYAIEGAACPSECDDWWHKQHPKITATARRLQGGDDVHFAEIYSRMNTVRGCIPTQCRITPAKTEYVGCKPTTDTPAEEKCFDTCSTDFDSWCIQRCINKQIIPKTWIGCMDACKDNNTCVAAIWGGTVGSNSNTQHSCLLWDGPTSVSALSCSEDGRSTYIKPPPCEAYNEC